MRKNASVRPMFDMLCDLHFGNTHEYVYEMVATTPALTNAIMRMAWDTDISTIYLACHGNRDGLKLHGEETFIDRRKLSKMLLEGSTKRSLTGIYLGACEFGTKELATYLLDRDPQLRWVAGYQNPSDFIDGTALDVMFFNRWFTAITDDPDARPRQIAKQVAAYLKETCRGLINTPAENNYGLDDEDAPGMGLSIFVRAQGPSGKIVDLLRDGE
ncbi:hypothetical protein ASG25_04680 [Rhizobium sp. Leaf384]|uniref:hypothetical protein n=1 Tax=unclassified Rhizobium TaxID=2613769 RepID=UPI000714972A|nr:MULTISPECIES: hypothetical protein [unclassified Rhizobium]KQS77246.1 hypothetical protein ASG58_09570 [Rhizobium sp. Leaf383]KQS80831.1 hypothetical protein ASG25_04680 [Rhizobium sp. Leaf384]